VRLVFRPVIGKDFPNAFECIRDGFLYDESSKQVLMAMWADLMSRQIVIAACIEDLDRTFGRSIVAFGMGAFVRPEFAEEISNGFHPYVPVRILELWRKFEAPLLDAEEIAAANGSGGLCFLNIHSGMPADLFRDPAAIPIFDQNEAFFHFGISGFRLNSILIEVYGDFERSTAAGMRYIERSNAAKGLAAYGITPRLHEQPFIFGIDSAESAQMRGTTLASLFTYSRPVLGLTAVEQELVQFALGGNTDQELATLLCVSYPTIRKRWDSIYAKVGARSPRIFDAASAGAGARRGSEKRRRVVRYVQFHREEIRPYAL
jgi:DNA-binding CsgD family transcriptional regulator